MNIAERIQQTRRTLAQSLPRLGESTGICIVSMAMLTMPVDVNAQVQPTPEIILYGTDTVRKHIYEHVAWEIPLIVGRRYWRFVSIESYKTYEPGSRGRLQEKAFYREVYPEYWVRDYREYALVIETDHYVDDGQEEGHKNIRWEVLGNATEDTMGENKKVRDFLPTINNAPAMDWAGKDSIVGTEITYQHPWRNLWTLATGSKKTETSSETSVMLVARHRSGRHRFTVYVDYGIDGSASDIITHNYSVFLNPGEVWTTSLSCPRGSYATVSMSARHNGRPRGRSQGTGYGASNSSVYFYWQIGI